MEMKEIVRSYVRMEIQNRSESQNSLLHTEADAFKSVVQEVCENLDQKDRLTGLDS